MLAGEKCVLRPIMESDVPRLVELVNSPEVRKYLRMVFPINDVREREWVERLYKGYPSEIVFGIVPKNEEGIIGTTGLHAIDWVNRDAVFGIAIWDARWWNKGIGTEATHLMVEYAFDQLNLHRVQLEVYEYNERAITVYKKVGFVEEGRRRKQKFLHGEYYDTIIMGILREEWETRR